jgi:acylphosphatase
MQIAACALSVLRTARENITAFALVMQKIADRIATLRPAGGMVASKMRNAKRYYVSGIVQGVGYRYFVERVSLRLRLTGYVRNLSDGRVEVYAAGDEDSLQALRAELRRGPAAASVTAVTEEESPLDSRFQNGFSIEYET